jgi:hypothetical protein
VGDSSLHFVALRMTDIFILSGAKNLMLLVGQKFEKSLISLILRFKFKFQGSYKIILVIHHI